MKITTTVRTADGRDIPTTWINGAEFDRTQAAAFAHFQRGVERHGGQIVSIAVA